MSSPGDGSQVTAPASRDLDASQVSLVDLLDRLLGTGVVVAGDVVVSLAGVDLVQIKLHALITSVRAEMTIQQGNWTGGRHD